MVFTVFIVFISLIGLIVLHEFGHFILAKFFGVKVEEFGVGYPPRLTGKRFGETLYSLNLLPFGAFVKIEGEIGKSDNQRSFSAQSIWKRALIVLGGVLSFWLISALLFSIVFSLGTRMAVDDNENNLNDPKVQIAQIAPNSPAQMAGLKPGDTIKEFSIFNFQFSIFKVKELQELIEKYKGQEITLTIERRPTEGGYPEVFNVSLVPRVSPPAGEGAMGVALVRTAIKSYPWWESPWQGILATLNMTGDIIQGYGLAIKNVISGGPSGVEMMGPVGVFHLFYKSSQLGINYFLQFLGMIAIYLAIFNILPIPAVDGGKLLFLGIEAIRKKPISEKVEQNVTGAFFLLLILLMILVTIKDISRLF
jgi:regulator of sigma E protease